MMKPTFAGISASSTQKGFISEETSTGVYQFATGEIPLRVFYRENSLYQG